MPTNIEIYEAWLDDAGISHKARLTNDAVVLSKHTEAECGLTHGGAWLACPDKQNGWFIAWCAGPRVNGSYEMFDSYGYAATLDACREKLVERDRRIDARRAAYNC